MALLSIAALLSFLLQTFVGRVYLIPSESMEPTLHGCAGCTGDRVVATKIAYEFGEPRAGDVVVFLGPPSWLLTYVSTRSDNVVVRGAQNLGSLLGLVRPDEFDLVKRVVATGGQTVTCCDARGRVQVDDVSLTEPYVRSDDEFTPGVRDCVTALRSRRCFPAVTVPEGNLWLMGDNRSHSSDSRSHMQDERQGAVPVGNVRGRVVARIWPLGPIGAVSSSDPQSE